MKGSELGETAQKTRKTVEYAVFNRGRCCSLLFAPVQVN
jgi:hypothetical protein